MEQKPFHESIVEALRDTKHPDGVRALGKLIIATKIPQNHEEISCAWHSNAAGAGIARDDATLFLAVEAALDHEETSP